MNRSEYMAIRPQFLSKYIPRYESVKANQEIQAGIADRIIQSINQDVEDQFQYTLKIDGSTAQINIFGALSENGPDWIDLYLGYNGTAYKNIIRATEEILKNPQIKNVIIPMNTPGGNMDLLDATYQAISVMAKQIPTLVINRGMIASAGVWLASAVGKVIASTPSAMMGSIGVAIDTMDFSGWYSSMGVREISLTNTESPNKRPDIGTPAGQQVYIKELDALYGVFVDRITSGMPVTRDAIKALKGELIIAAEAVKIGLMSEIAGESPATRQEKAGKSVKGEAEMDEDVKKALDSMSGSIAAVTETVGKLAESVTKISAAAVKPEEKVLSKEDKTFCLNILQGDTYPKAVTGEAAKVLAGESDMGILKAMTAAVDAVNASKKTEGEEKPGETIPTGSIPTNQTQSKANEGIIDSEAAAKAELARVKGEA